MKQATDFCLENKASARYTYNLNSKICGKQLEAIKACWDRLERDQEQEVLLLGGPYLTVCLCSKAQPEGTDRCRASGQVWSGLGMRAFILTSHEHLLSSTCQVGLGPNAGRALWLAGKEFKKKRGAHLSLLNDCM